MIDVTRYEDRHFAGVAALWREAFPDDAPWNRPEAAIPEKVRFQPDLFLVALAGEAVVGSVMVGYEGHRGLISHIAVLHAHRGRGIGRALLGHAEARLAALGRAKVDLQVVASNRATAAFYARSGYAVEERISMSKLLRAVIRSRNPARPSPRTPMPLIDPRRALLVVVDLQERLVPAMSGGDAAVRNARRLVEAAGLVGVPTVVTEQNPGRLGPTVSGVGAEGPALAKMCFSAAGAEGFAAARGGRTDVVIAGCEAHVCVLQTGIALLDAGCRVFVVEDAVASRLDSSKAAALRRLERLGAEVVTAEMAVFEWLGTAAHPRFREAAALIK